MEVSTNVGDARTSDITAEEHSTDPERPAKDVVEEVGRVVHLSSASDRGAEGANNRDETGKNHGATAIFLIKLMGTLEMAATEKKGVFAAIERGTRRTANPVAELVANDGAEDAGDEEPSQRDDILAGEDASGDQKGVARKEEANKQAGLYKDDRANQSRPSPAD